MKMYLMELCMGGEGMQVKDTNTLSVVHVRGSWA
jgi:hypothetical protein